MSEIVCRLCPRRCGARRTETAGGGYCGLPNAPVLARAALHFGEEPCLGGEKGAGCVFFSGCTLSCRFCQNDRISHGGVGERVTVQRLAEIFAELEAAGARTLDLVSPTPYLPQIRQALLLRRPGIPVVWNTGGYERADVLPALRGLVDVFLPDLKYVHGDIADDLSGAADYPQAAVPAIEAMAEMTGPVELDGDGIIRRGTIVRHLVLPGHTRESMAVLDRLAPLRDRVWVSLMFQYTPPDELGIDPVRGLGGRRELTRRLTARECEKVFSHMAALGIEGGYVQGRESSGAAMLPRFDLTGVHGGAG